MTNSNHCIIDVGTNSVRALYARVIDNEVKKELKTLKTVRIGEGVSSTGRINDAAMKRSVDAIYDFVKQAREWEKSVIISCFATSAVREAENSAEFCNLVKARCGCDVDVIPGEFEAECGFTGVFKNGGTGGIIDIGGGSTEIIFGNGSGIEYLRSFNIGCVRAMELFGADYSAARAEAANVLSKVEIPFINSNSFFAIGGTATTIAAIDAQMEEYDSSRINGYILNLKQVEDVFNMLSKMTLEQRYNVVGLQAKRADIIVYGVAILLEFMYNAGLKKVMVSDNDNMEGYLCKKFSFNT